MQGKAGAADIMYGLRRGMIDYRLSKIIRNTIPLRLAKQSVICIRIPALWKTLMFKKGAAQPLRFPSVGRSLNSRGFSNPRYPCPQGQNSLQD